ncbi:ImcF-related family protein [Burkholderia ubonensis]|uniref:ImcF-related family protein n=1 Tax=Burkholderia ubonensis TaxID=101571 RepID=UPI00075E480C|nr:ImcF-related family protein [Burkholderia ubonensis]KVG77037.1 type VI secretion protein VasK [Burkholderia ubonensis]KVH15974.1 type VI secretion protein VasK [Burkholderia ubonensis]KVH44677.1 type VI secretion protein VasK [Burkholderia ubonensis]KVH82511.1 type VI secretion protein VasK [Burkholderia ubonensis]KVM29158.1 type VI secretion protein VasK [Burkholderia ubonensis]
MSSKKMSGYWIVVVGLTVSAGILAYYMGDAIHPSRLVRILVVAIAGALLLAMEGLVRGAWRWTARVAVAKERSRYGRDPAARADATETAAAAVTGNQATGLKEALRHRYGWRWRYRLPWLFVAGADSTIGRFSPELAERGWMITDDAVLLWGAQGPDGRPDDVWLRRIRRMRCRRPLDAIVLMLDGTTPLPDAVRGTRSWGLHLARITHLLRWSAPVYVLDLAGDDPIHHADTPVTGCEFSRSTDAPAIEAALLELRNRLADTSIGQLARNGDDRYASDLSTRLDTRSGPLARWIVNLSEWQRRPLPIAGAFFSPWPTAGTESAHFPLWRYLADAAKRSPGRRTGAHPITVLSVIALAAVGLWGAGMLTSGLTNARGLALTHDVLRTFDGANNPATRLRALLALQQRIEFHEARVQYPTLFSRFGLNHDQDVLTALWTHYTREARPQLIAPVQQNIEAQLVDLTQMPTTELDDQLSRFARDGHTALKTYLMLAEPARADAAFLTPQLVRYWRGGAGLSPGEKLDLSQRLLSFYAQHLSTHPDWRLALRDELVGGARQTLLAVIGVKNSDDTIYQGILDSVGHKYPDQTLASLTAGTDTRGLLRTSASVPGAFTRQAWDGTIEAAIDASAKRNGVTADWVLGTGGASRNASAMTPDALRAALRARYFADYAEHWQTFMNGIVCEPARTLPAAIAQLKLIADSRQSPVITLMKSVEYQGGAGAVRTSLSDTLVTKAQSMLAGKDDAPQAASPDPAGPLGASFGPVLRLVASGNSAAASAASDLSLQRFTERITMLRLKLQQIADSPDADSEARQVAQALFQGRSSELADTLAYAQLVAASLGEQWTGMGQALFVQPIAQATQAVLEPAQASLNDAWRQTIVATWNRSFAGRYPFANTANDASLPELARFLRPQGGLVGSFLATQLAGVLTLQGDQWVPASSGSGASRAARTIDPAFLNAINMLQRIAAHLLAQGEPRYAFDLKPVPTSGVTDTRLSVDGQTLHYYNQQETWQTLTWPSNEPQKAGTRLEWQTERSGTNVNLEFGGRWALVRLLERAHVSPVDTATYQITWQAVPPAPPSRSATAQTDDHDALTAQGPLTSAPSSLAYPLTYLMRTDVGKGPLELLSLRGFALPSRIFVPGASTPRAGGSASQPPPLPPGALAAARHASVPVPGGPMPE